MTKYLFESFTQEKEIYKALFSRLEVKSWHIDSRLLIN